MDIKPSEGEIQYTKNYLLAKNMTYNCGKLSRMVVSVYALMAARLH